MQKLTIKQKAFADYYIQCSNATEAAIKAGYSKKYASTNTDKLLKNTSIKAYIDEQLSKISSNRIADAKEVMEYLTSVLRGESVSETVVVEGVGDGCSEARAFKKAPEEKDKLKAAQLLGKRHGLELTKEAKEKQRLELEKMQLEAQATETALTYKGIPAKLMAPAFSKTFHNVLDSEYHEFVLPGGRGSTKSSFISLIGIDLLENNPEMHMAVFRQVGETLRDSVYAQMCWAIQQLGLEYEYTCTVSPMKIIKKSTKQQIFFRGCDDPMKSKGIKPPFGHIGILWFEELDQYKGPEAIRTVTQSVVRGGDECYIFKSFNPPKSATNWANKYVNIPKDGMLVTNSTYLDVPKGWLGQVFLEEAEHLKDTNPTAYDNEYMGIANGSGGNVFDNVEIRTIADEELSQFDRIYFGVDFGWYPDIYAFSKCYYDSARLILYILDEYTCNKKSNRETYKELVNNHGITGNDLITCDSSEPKSIGDYKSYGLLARGAIKGPGSVDYSMKWLQSLNKIVIDNRRCPVAAEEFLNYEYERDKEGNVITGYPDKDNHMIDSVRYGMESVWKKKGR